MRGPKLTSTLSFFLVFLLQRSVNSVVMTLERERKITHDFEMVGISKYLYFFKLRGECQGILPSFDKVLSARFIFERHSRMKKRPPLTLALSDQMSAARF